MDAYFDHNATSLIDPDVLQTFYEACLKYPGNPSSIHSLGRKARAHYLRAKDQIASAFNTSSAHLFFTSSATEALNWLLRHKPYKHIISSDLEHAAIFNTLKALGTPVTFLHPGSLGVVTEAMLESALTPHTDLIILGAANSETGIIQDTQPLSLLAKKHNIPFFVDAVGLWGKAPFTLDPHVTAYVISSHKIHGPKGIAAIIHKTPSELNPWLYGGHQEGGKRSGTENVAAAIGFSQAVKKLSLHPELYEEIRAKRDYFEAKLHKMVPITVIGHDLARISNTSCIRFIGLPGESLLQLLDHHQIYASHGSACNSGAIEPSRVLIQMDLGFKNVKECLRFSFSKYTTYEEIDYAIDILSKLSKELI